MPRSPRKQEPKKTEAPASGDPMPTPEYPRKPFAWLRHHLFWALRGALEDAHRRSVEREKQSSRTRQAHQSVDKIDITSVNPYFDGLYGICYR